MHDLFMIALGTVAGVVGGFFGVGGGIVIIPALGYFLGYSEHRAQGTSIVAMLLPVGLLAALKYHKTGAADVRGGLLIAAGLFAGAWIGAVLASHVPDLLLRRLFAVLLMAVSIKMLVGK
ncbi:MAG: sulfite exporter TauE/SafE family protein [Deltaproteobacteria bacterium]|nr:sulfite exporter TauE/SafE family protein [Deltaproteobacteria bacterium]